MVLRQPLFVVNSFPTSHSARRMQMNWKVYKTYMSFCDCLRVAIVSENPGLFIFQCSIHWRIREIPDWGPPIPNSWGGGGRSIIEPIFPKHWNQMKKIGGEGVSVICQCRLTDAVLSKMFKCPNLFSKTRMLTCFQLVMLSQKRTVKNLSFFEWRAVAHVGF